MANPSSPSGLTGLIGQTFGGRYRLESPLGKGGFGAVFKATQLATGQTVAVKVMQVRSGRRAPTIDRQVARFHREMRLGASLNHPHIVRLIDSGTTENGLMYTVFEYVPGETLHSLVRGQGPLAPVVARDIMMQVLDALTAAHAAGIVHRDLKPQNIMVTGTIARDHAKVLDFGISGLLADAATEDLSRITLTREALGTPVYAAPEQLRGDPPTTRSDIYSWGLVFIELLIGQPVMKGRSVADVFHRQLSSEPVPIPVAVVNHPLGRLLASTVEKHVRRRVRSAAGLLAMLEAVDLSTLPDEGRVPLGSRASVEVSTTDFGGPTTDTVDLYLDDDEVQPPTDVTLADFSGPTGPTSSPGLGAVRRPVTALSVSVGVSSEGPVDVEVMDELLHDQLGWCKETVTDLGGHVVGVLGDRMLAVWGYPEANEHDARRAARAALDIAGQLQRRGRVLRSRQDVDLHYRAGLHSGILVRRGSERLGGVVTQVAARLESSAVDGSILASRPLWRQLSTRLEFHSGPAIGGISGGSWRLVGEGLDEALAATPAGGRRAVLVGRGREYGVLREAWRLVGEKRGQAIIVHSEAGVGKSRLVRELRGVVAQDGGEWLEVACAPEDGAASLGPIVALLRRVAGATGKPGARALDAWLRARGLEDAEQRTLVVQLVGLPLVEGLSPVALPPGRQRELRMQALGTVLAAGGQSGQVLVVEDLHWADPSTQELFGALASGAAEAGGLVLATTRPTPVALPESAHMLVLERLDGDAAAELARNAVDHGELSPELVARIVERSDGVPLFIEELARATVEGGRATLVDGEWQARGDDDAVPMSLFSMLQERLDRLGAARQTVQLAAALGRELDHRVLSAVALLDESTLQAHLDELILAGLLVRRRVLDAPGYLFRHALIRDTALDTLGAQERREVHAHIAETIERDLPDLVESRPELLALHYGAAGVHDKALDYGHKAAFGCLLRSENFEALALCERALSLADELPEAARGPARLGFLSVLIPACMATRGWADPTLKAAVDEALELTEHTPDHPAAFRCAGRRCSTTTCRAATGPCRWSWPTPCLQKPTAPALQPRRSPVSPRGGTASGSTAATPRCWRSGTACSRPTTLGSTSR